MGAALAASALVSMPAQAACWNSEEVAAATVREFQSMLMVATLRCQVAGHDMVGDYNLFLKANKPAIQRMNDRIKAHFIKSAGPTGGQTAYDSFVTSLANGYGAQGSSAEVCDNMDSLAREAQMMAGSEEGLVMLAARQGLATRMPGGACGGSGANVAMAAGSASNVGGAAGASERVAARDR